METDTHTEGEKKNLVLLWGMRERETFVKASQSTRTGESGWEANKRKNTKIRITEADERDWQKNKQRQMGKQRVRQMQTETEAGRDRQRQTASQRQTKPERGRGGGGERERDGGKQTVADRQKPRESVWVGVWGGGVVADTERKGNHYGVRLARGCQTSHFWRWLRHFRDNELFDQGGENDTAALCRPPRDGWPRWRRKPWRAAGQAAKGAP